MIDLTIGFLLVVIAVLTWVSLRLNDAMTYWRRQAHDYRLMYSQSIALRTRERAEYEDDRKRWTAYR